MTVRLATASDRPAIVSLYNASPLRTVYGPVSAIDARLLLADAFIVVNDPLNDGVLTACALAHADDTAREKAVCINLVVALTLPPLKPVLKAYAQQARSRGYGVIYGYVSLHPALASARAYFDTVCDHEDVGTQRIYRGTPDVIEANA